MLELIQNNPVLFTFLGILAGAIGTPIINYFVGLKKNKSDEATQLRTELWAELKELRQRIDHLEAENEVWRSRTFKAEETLALLHQKLISRGCDKCIKFIQFDYPSHVAE